MNDSVIYADRAAVDRWYTEHLPGCADDDSWVGCSMDQGDVVHVAPEPFRQHMAGRSARVVLRTCGAACAPVPAGLVAAARRLAEASRNPLVLIELVAQGDGYMPYAGVIDGGRACLATLRFLTMANDLQSRARGLVQTNLLHAKTVAVIGVGSGGSTIALELAKAGVGRFVLVDHDRLEVSNVARHVCGLGDVGRLKTFAMRDFILAHNPTAVVETHEFEILSDPQRLRHVVAGADLLVGATDTDRSRQLVNRVAVEQEITALFGRVLAGAYAGDVLRVRPHAGACLACVFTTAVLQEKRREITDMAEAAAAHPEYTDAAMLDQVIQVGLASDIAPVAIFMVKLALTELLRGQSGALDSLETDFAGDFYTWANRRERLYRSFPPLGQGLPHILSWIPGPAERRPNCPACGSPDMALNMANGAT